MSSTGRNIRYRPEQDPDEIAKSADGDTVTVYREDLAAVMSVAASGPGYLDKDRQGKFLAAMERLSSEMKATQPDLAKDVREWLAQCAYLPGAGKSTAMVLLERCLAVLEEAEMEPGHG